MTKKLILIDGTALAYRHYFSQIRNPLRNSKGVNTTALFGVLSNVLKLIEHDKPQALIVAFDAGGKTFRHELYGDYKATRVKMPDELAELMPIITEALKVLEISVVEQTGYEADDIVGTLAFQAHEQGFDIVIYTGDKDFFQLLQPGIEILTPAKADGSDEKLWTVENAHEKFGVPASSVIDLLALMGDSSDNIPGLPGVGEKTAVKLLLQFGSMENVLAHASEIPGALGKKILENKDLAILSKDLATIRTDMPFIFSAQDAMPKTPNLERIMPILREYELLSLASKITPSSSPDTARNGETYLLVDSYKRFEQLANELCTTQKFVFDTETTSENAMIAKIVGISFCMEARKAFYLPFDHKQEGGLFAHPDNLDFEKCRALLKEIFASRALKIGQNIKYDMKVLKNAGIDVAGEVFDTMVASYLLDPGTHRHGLDELAFKHFAHTTTKFENITGKRGSKQITFDFVEPKKACDYSCEDADITMRLYELFAPALEKLNVKNLFEKIEMPLVRVLFEMEMAGISLNVAQLEELGREASVKRAELAKTICDAAGMEFNVDSPKQLGEVLFEKMGLPGKRKTKTGFSTDADVMEKLAAQGFEIAKEVVQYREMAKLLSTYIEALPKLICPKTGRVHTTFNQTVAATGRLSSSDPNLQNIPVRTPFGARIRECFVPKAGFLLMSADYSQIELRLMAHFSADPNLVAAFNENLDIHAHTASVIFGKPLIEVNREMRSAAKTVNFGVIYGQGAFALSEQLGIPYSEADAFINQYFEKYPKIKDFVEAQAEFATQHGYVETIMGRRRYLPEISAESNQMRQAAKRVAVNTPLQGSAADIIKSAMINIDNRLKQNELAVTMLLQVHDELVFEFAPTTQEVLTEIVKSEMEKVVQLSVPLVADIGIGANWLVAH